MNAQPSNAGFVGLHNPAGMMLVGAAFLLITTIIVIGGIYFRHAQQKDRETRQRLREAQREDR